MDNILFWFRNDLRIHDNEAFSKAAEMGRVLPVYIIDKRQYVTTKFGFKKSGIFRARFLLESLNNLKKNLQALGSDLMIRVGIPEEELAKLAKQYQVKVVVASKEVTQEETSLEFELSQRLKPLNIDMDLYWGATLYHVRDLPFQIKFLPDIFTDFRKIMDKQSIIREQIAAPQNLHTISEFDTSEIPSLGDLGFEENLETLPFYKGGETAALEQLDRFIWQTQGIKTYKETRNQLLGYDYSSRLSAWLSIGCISPRKIYEEVKKFEKEVVKNESTYWVIFELIWRDYFHLVALKYGIRLFKTSGIKQDMNKTWRNNVQEFELWMKGQTGIPMIDANMRELNQTGFMSNRGRQLVANFFAKDLKLQWWWGAQYFESLLIDYDVCSNWGNWNYIAGIGNDPRPNRYFNIKLQGEKYDPKAEYIKHWIPKLRDVNALDIHEIGYEGKSVPEYIPAIISLSKEQNVAL